VGGKAQLPAYRAVAGDLRLFYSQFEELEVFSRFGSRLDERTRTTLARGRAVREALKQAQYEPSPASAQIGVLLAATAGVFDNLTAEQVVEASTLIERRLAAELPQVIQTIDHGERLDQTQRDEVVRIAREAVGGQSGHR
jgi:F-type H+-transporting ATPase subunit alpha